MRIRRSKEHKEALIESKVTAKLLFKMYSCGLNSKGYTTATKIYIKIKYKNCAIVVATVSGVHECLISIFGSDMKSWNNPLLLSTKDPTQHYSADMQQDSQVFLLHCFHFIGSTLMLTEIMELVGGSHGGVIQKVNEWARERERQK